MKVRVYYRVDGSVIILHPSVKAVFAAVLAGESEQEAIDRLCQIHVEATKGTFDRHGNSKDLTGLDYDDVDPSTLPDRKDRDKWRGSKASGLRVDPSVVTLAERRQAVEDEIDVLVAKTSPTVKDSMQAMRLKRKLDRRDY